MEKNMIESLKKLGTLFVGRSWHRQPPSSLIPHPSSLIPHPSSLILHPSSFILHPSSFILLFLLLPGCSRPQPSSLPEFESWEIAQVKGSRLGYAQTTVRHAEQDGRQVVKVRQKTRMEMQRFGQTIPVEMEYADTETLDGRLIDFETTTPQGADPMRTTGKVVGNQLELRIESRGHKQDFTIAWSAEAGGMVAPELSLRRQPMKPGEHRVVRHLGVGNNISTTEMTAHGEEQVALPAGSFRLLRIDVINHLPGNGQQPATELKRVLWTDSDGDVVKSLLEAMNMESYRVTKEVALAKTGLAPLDLGEATFVKIERAIPHAHDTKRVRYRIHLEGGDPAAVLPSGPSQEVKRIDDHTAEVTVLAIRPGGANKDAAAEPPDDECRKPNNFIQSDDPLIVTKALEAVGDETDPWKMAVALEDFVHRAVTMKDFSQALATASEVARSGEGDCTEHAVYLAALARARGIPARVAIGLVYMPQYQAFGYHMWTEMYIDGRWIGLDGTLAKGGIGGGHLKLSHGTLAGAAAYNSFLPTMQVVGRMRVEALDWE